MTAEWAVRYTGSGTIITPAIDETDARSSAERHGARPGITAEVLHRELPEWTVIGTYGPNEPADPALDHSTHSMQWVGRCAECPPERAS